MAFGSVERPNTNTARTSVSTKQKNNRMHRTLHIGYRESGTASSPQEKIVTQVVSVNKNQRIPAIERKYGFLAASSDKPRPRITTPLPAVRVNTACWFPLPGERSIAFRVGLTDEGLILLRIKLTVAWDGDDRIYRRIAPNACTLSARLWNLTRPNLRESIHEVCCYISTTRQRPSVASIAHSFRWERNVTVANTCTDRWVFGRRCACYGRSAIHSQASVKKCKHFALANPIYQGEPNTETETTWMLASLHGFHLVVLLIIIVVNILWKKPCCS